MKIRSYMGIGIRCSHCGSFQKKQVDVFDGSGADTKMVVCSACGKRILEITREGRRNYRFEASCGICGDRHKFFVPVAEALHTSLKKLMCPMTRVTSFVLGNDKSIEKFMDNELEDEIRSAPYDERGETASIFDTVSRAGGAFKDPNELFECLEYFKRLSAEGRIGCECGESLIQLQVEEDGFRVICSSCGRDMFLGFTTRDGIDRIMNISEIFLT